MKITLNKSHLNHAIGDEIEVTAEQAEYFRRIGMVDQKPTADFNYTTRVAPEGKIANITHQPAKRGPKGTK